MFVTHLLACCLFVCCTFVSVLCVRYERVACLSVAHLLVCLSVTHLLVYCVFVCYTFVSELVCCTSVTCFFCYIVIHFLFVLPYTVFVECSC